MTTTIPRKRYYVILSVAFLVAALSFAFLIVYIRQTNRQAAIDDAARVETFSRQQNYRSCVDRNELRAVIATILQGGLERPRIPAVTPEGRAQERAYRALVRSYLIGGELVPRDCTSIIEGGKP